MKLKRVLMTILGAIALALSVFAFTACKRGGEVKPVAITANSAEFAYENKTLKDYMDFLQGKGELTFTVESGMVTAVNGTANTTKSFWMLYTDDGENANRTWGTVEYGGKTYGSATLGAEALTVKQGCTYVWSYQTF